MGSAGYHFGLQKVSTRERLLEYKMPLVKLQIAFEFG